MVKRLTQQQFIERAKKVHGNKYSYKNAKYVKSRIKVEITCKKHGSFFQNPDSHINQSVGCPKCGREAIGRKNISKARDSFVQKAIDVHGNVYNYSQVQYINHHTKVQIACKKHGAFFQIPRKHLSGFGCPKCGTERTAKKKIATSRRNFAKKASIIHKNKYDYSRVQYINNKTPVTIICPIHNEFSQIPVDHLGGHGCKKCADEASGWSYSKWEEAGKVSREFKGYKVYVVCCYTSNEDSNETFIKVGKTFKSLKQRLNSGKIPYEYDVIHIVESQDAKFISMLELNLHRALIDHRYNPNIPFKGQTECFTYTPETLKLIEKFLEENKEKEEELTI